MSLANSPRAAALTDEVQRTRALIERNFAVDHGELIVGGLPIGPLASQHGTPLFVYDQGLLQRQWQALRQALPDRFEIYYSVKANPNQALLQFFLDRGCGLEIASSGELRQALVAGCDPEIIFFAGPGKTDAELTAALECNLGEIHVESLNEARRIARMAERRNRPARIALRVNPAGPVEGGAMRMGGRATPFGIDEDQLDAVVAALRDESWLEIVGLHLFVGTQILDHEVLLVQYRAAIDIARRLSAQLGRPLATLDFGGGLGVPYFAAEKSLDLSALQSALRELMIEIEHEPALSGARLVVEPGRFLVAEAGLYLARVLDVKISRGKKFVVVDGGMHHHLAASGNLGQTIKRNFPLAVVNKLDEPAVEAVDVVGPLCTPLDTLARSALLPPVEVGDLIAIFQSGAYARAASPLGFLSHPPPPEVLVADQQARLIRLRGNDDHWLIDQRGLPQPRNDH